MKFRHTLCSSLIMILLTTAQYTWADTTGTKSNTGPDSLRALLQEVRKQVTVDQQVEAARLQKFKDEHDLQAQKLAEAEARLKEAERRRNQLQAQFDANELKLSERQTTLDNRSGQLGEVFGVIKQQAEDFSGILQTSLISSQYPDRHEQLAFSNKDRIPTVSDLKNLWLLLQQEMTESAETAFFEASVANSSGQLQTKKVLRLGAFNVITANGEYLDYIPDQQQLQIYAKQPDTQFGNQAKSFYQGATDTLLIDPSRGGLLALLGQTPDIKERIQQGGTIGYIIMGLGALGFLFALLKLVSTIRVTLAVKRQLNSPDNISDRNPLGRVLLSAQTGKTESQEALENRVSEALLKEVPHIERGLTFIKLLAAVAPLLGLLGTVTGMIGTFQSITLFGTGDPKLMAGGISQALMTTVLGLSVAIPLLFGHSFIAAQARRLLQILQQKSLALTLPDTPVRELAHAA
ncbi:MotA/TolQ/ExbB proton channel [Oleiphilus messinensis]|uniref:MotA/TolQ/ExbB proton channel n=1 Tax=Oleiphilus messinensis TaxID=141451 RepID=A0A1Y0IEH2_9GAMM|nr:MotA/TolQ/ExbB proton channel family protein [Oleiphilus messinensis]ARU57875.1 MotA/TolQ/ExbB proton channel [Oleiphilus messinensis]